MKRFFLLLRIFAVLLLLGSLATWFATGANKGWTKTERVEKKIDPVTELEYQESHPAFLPGIELLILGTGCAVILFAVSFIRVRSKTHKTN